MPLKCSAIVALFKSEVTAYSVFLLRELKDHLLHQSQGLLGHQRWLYNQFPSYFSCFPLPSGTCWTPGMSFPWCCLPASSSVCLALSLCIARYFWPDLIFRRHVLCTSSLSMVVTMMTKDHHYCHYHHRQSLETSAKNQREREGRILPSMFSFVGLFYHWHFSTAQLFIHIFCQHQGITWNDLLLFSFSVCVQVNATDICPIGTTPSTDQCMYSSSVFVSLLQFLSVCLYRVLCLCTCFQCMFVPQCLCIIVQFLHVCVSTVVCIVCQCLYSVLCLCTVFQCMLVPQCLCIFVQFLHVCVSTAFCVLYSLSVFV